MHEYSLVSALLDQVQRQLMAHPGGEVRRVHVSVGELAGVDPDLFASAFDTFKEASCCAGASLLVRRVPARWVCPRCGHDRPEGSVLRCPECECPARLEAGSELVLERLELEVPPAQTLRLP